MATIPSRHGLLLLARVRLVLLSFGTCAWAAGRLVVIFIVILPMVSRRIDHNDLMVDLDHVDNDDLPNRAYLPDKHDWHTDAQPLPEDKHEAARQYLGYALHDDDGHVVCDGDVLNHAINVDHRAGRQRRDRWDRR